MSSTSGEADKLSSLTSAQPCRHFSLAAIQSATYDFDDELVIGRGGFGKVYKGRICIEETSHVVAIKRLDSTSDQGAPEFRAEIEMLTKLRHCHLVSLIGFCDDHKEMILVYEYMPHGTLYDHLHKADTPLTWVQRLKIAIGAGRGLDYLHTGIGTQHGVIHRDVKSSNILLDENWGARISDFGLSKVGPINQSSSYIYASVKGTFGYLDPEYFYTRKLTRKTDVFAFGVVLFELLSGRLPVDERFGEEQCGLVRWAQKCVKGRKLDQMVDSSIRGTVFPKCLKQFAQIADRCLYSVPKERPSMTEVVASLQVLLELQERCDNSAESSGIMGFSWKIHKYLVSTSKQNSDQSGTRSPKSHENHMNQHPSINKNDSDHGEMPRHHGELVASVLKKFTYDELEYGTCNFDQGTRWVYDGYVEVYIGLVDKTTYSPYKVDTGLHIVIKRLHRYKQFDLEMLKEYSHPNLLKLLGYCLEQKQLFLVYEFMPNGNFQDCLCSGTVAELPLVTKVKIAVGIARGIIYMHKTQDGGVVADMYLIRGYTKKLSESSRRYKPFELEINHPETWTATVGESGLDRRQILLDEDFTAKLSDYDVVKFVHGLYSRITCEDDDDNLVHGDYFPGLGKLLLPGWLLYLPSPCGSFCYGDGIAYVLIRVILSEPFQLHSNLFGFTVVLAEVLMGKKIKSLKQFQKIEKVWCRRGKKSLRHIAEFCFQICNEVDSESKMLTLLEKYEKHIQAICIFFPSLQFGDPTAYF